MKHILISLIGCLAAMGTAAYADFTLARDGKPTAEIVIGAAPSSQASDAAGELQSYLARISSATLPIVEQRSARRPAILVGWSAAVGAANSMGVAIPTGLAPQFNEEGYVVACDGNTLLLAGNETEPYQGTYYAVADLLESLGCRWYFPGKFGEVVPRRSTIIVKPAKRLVHPEFRARDIWYSGHLATTAEQQRDYMLWKRHNRMSQTALWSNGSSFLQNPVDDSTYKLLPKEKYWATHPEYYALNADGSRSDRFICMSNPAAVKAAADTIIQYFKDNPDNYAFAFSPPDAPVLCQCADCTRAMHGGYGGEGNGDVSDPYFRFVFQVADMVREPCPDRWIITMAYYNRCRPPEGVEGMHPNVLIQHAYIQQCSLHSWADKSCPTGQLFATILDRWSQLTAGEVLYEYDPHDWTHLQRPVWRAQGIAEDFRFAKAHNGWGYSDEGQMAWLSTGLNYYVRAKLAWNLNADPARVEKEWCDTFFGPAAGPMYKYYSTMERGMRTSNAHTGSWEVDAIFHALSRPLLNECGEYLAQARALASAEPFRSRVAAFYGHFDRMDAAVRAREAMARGDYAKAAACGDDMVKAVARVNDTMLLQDAGPWGGPLSGAGIAAYARGIAPYTDGTAGKLVAVLPQDALFRTDPGPKGVVYRWYQPRLDTSAWRPIKLTTGWQNQGVMTAEGNPYSGTAWYRVKLHLDSVPSADLRLYIPQLRASGVWLWCNGTIADNADSSNHGQTSLSLGRLLHPGDNLLAIRVSGDSGFNLPPFVYLPQ